MRAVRRAASALLAMSSALVPLALVPAGAYVLLEHDYTLALQALLSGETKGKDTQLGVPLDDTAVTNLFLGPRVLFTWGTSLALEGALDLPVLEHNTSLQIVPDYRLRGAAIWRF